MEHLSRNLRLAKITKKALEEACKSQRMLLANGDAFNDANFIIAFYKKRTFFACCKSIAGTG